MTYDLDFCVYLDRGVWVIEQPEREPLGSVAYVSEPDLVIDYTESGCLRRLVSTAPYRGCGTPNVTVTPGEGQDFTERWHIEFQPRQPIATEVRHENKGVELVVCRSATGEVVSYQLTSYR